MAVEHGGAVAQKISVPAGEALTTKQYHFVKWDGTNNTVIVCTGATDKPLGVLQNAPASGEIAEVTVAGPTKIVASGNLTANGTIGTHSNGRAATYTAGSDSTKYLVGHLIGAAGADGVVGSAFINCPSAARGA